MKKASFVPTLYYWCPNPTDATSFYRGRGVIEFLHRIKPLNTIMTGSMGWDTLAGCSVVFLQRPYGNKLYQGAKIAKANHIPLWLDWDDSIFIEDIPDWNPAKRHFSNPVDQTEMRETLKLADVVTVSTEALKIKLSEYNDNVVVIPNAHNDYIFPWEYNYSEVALINWRGSASHDADLKAIGDSLAKIKAKYPKWIMNFIGPDAEQFKGKFEFNLQKPMDIIEYFNFIYKMNPRIQLVPLEDLYFNHCKSNIGWIEGTYSGAVTIAPEVLAEFNRPGVLRYKDIAEFEKHLDEAIQYEVEDLYEASWTYIKENLLLSKVNQLRWQVIDSLIKGKK